MSDTHLSIDRYVAKICACFKDTMYGEGRVIVQNVALTPRWWSTRKIRLFWEPGIDFSTVLLVGEEIKATMESLGIGPFSFEFLAQKPSAIKQIQSSIRNSRDGIVLDDNRLLELSVSEDPGGIQHGNIYITTRPFLNGFGFRGAADFSCGTMILSLYGNRQHNHEVLKRDVRHETVHLLGMPCHCDLFKYVGNYTYDPKCNMHGNGSSYVLCQKCTHSIGMWWEFIGDMESR